MDTSGLLDVELARQHVVLVLKPKRTRLVQISMRIGFRCLFQQARFGLRALSAFKVSYWHAYGLLEDFGRHLGESIFFVDCFFGGNQENGFGPNACFTPSINWPFEAKNGMTGDLPVLARFADGVYCVAA